MTPKGPIDIPDGMQEQAAALAKALARQGVDVFTVGIGLKETAGRITGTLALLVYVPVKTPKADVPSKKLIPAEFGGFPTDVVEHRPIPIVDHTAHNPLVGGIEISPDAVPVGDIAVAVEPGTLGAIVRRRRDGRELLLTCAHVAAPGTQAPGAIHQPAVGNAGSTVVGRTISSNDVFDCAIVEPNGTRSLRREIKDVGPVRGTAPVPKIAEPVKKRGRTTGLTTGLVRAHLFDPPGGPQPGSPGNVPFQIEVVGFPFGRVFALPGDSGSAVLTTRDQVVGLAFAVRGDAQRNPDGRFTFVSLISHVQNALGVEVATDPGKAYFFSGPNYIRWDIASDMVDVGPAPISRFWKNFPFAQGVDAAVNWGDGKAYFFRGANYIRWDIASDMVDVGPAPIAKFWKSFPFAQGVDAAVNWGNGKAYFFRGPNYIRWDIASDMVDVGPAPIAKFWKNFPFAQGVDAAVNWGNGKAYFFRGPNYIRWDIASDMVDVGPAPIAKFWNNFPFAQGVDAAVDWPLLP